MDIILDQRQQYCFNVPTFNFHVDHRFSFGLFLVVYAMNVKTYVNHQICYVLKSVLCTKIEFCGTITFSSFYEVLKLTTIPFAYSELQYRQLEWHSVIFARQSWLLFEHTSYNPVLFIMNKISLYLQRFTPFPFPLVCVCIQLNSLINTKVTILSYPFWDIKLLAIVLYVHLKYPVMDGNAFTLSLETI